MTESRPSKSTSPYRAAASVWCDSLISLVVPGHKRLDEFREMICRSNFVPEFLSPNILTRASGMVGYPLGQATSPRLLIGSAAPRLVHGPRMIPSSSGEAGQPSEVAARNETSCALYYALGGVPLERHAAVIATLGGHLTTHRRCGGPELLPALGYQPEDGLGGGLNDAVSQPRTGWQRRRSPLPESGADSRSRIHAVSKKLGLGRRASMRRTQPPVHRTIPANRRETLQLGDRGREHACQPIEL